MFIQSNLLHVVDFAPKKDPRKVLIGVLVERNADHYVLTATDGKRLLSLKVSDKPKEAPEPISYIVPRESWEQMRKAVTAAKSDGVEISLNPETFVITADVFGSGEPIQLLFNAMPKDSKYPQWRHILPAPETIPDEIDINAKIMSEFCKTLAKLTDDFNYSVHMRFDGGEARPMLASLPSAMGVEATALIMPLKFTRIPASEETDEPADAATVGTLHPKDVTFLYRPPSADSEGEGRR